MALLKKIKFWIPIWIFAMQKLNAITLQHWEIITIRRL